MKTLTLAQKKAMLRGREAAQRERDREGIRRVKVFRRWLANGSVLREIPEVPTDADYKAWRRKGR